MREEAWYRMLVVSLAVHIVLIGAFSFTFPGGRRKAPSISTYYSVNLVGGLTSQPAGGEGKGTVPEKHSAPPKPTPPSPAKETKAVKTPPQKPLPVKEEKSVSLSKKRVVEKTPTAAPSKQDISHLEDRLREMRKRSAPLDVTGSRGGAGGTGPGGLPVSGSGEGGRALDPATERYLVSVWNKIKSAWALPGMSSQKKNLETIVTIRIRKDGRIVDVNMERRSGNRLYDETVMRVLRSVDPLPSIPDSLNTDELEVGFRFLPGELS